MLFKLRSSLTIKLTLLVLGGTSLVLTAVLVYNYVYSRKIILSEAEQRATNLALSVARRIEQEFRAIEKVPSSLAGFMETGQWDKQTLPQLIERVVKDNSEIFGATVAFAPNGLGEGLPAYAPYYYKTKNGLKFEQLATDSYNYFIKDWYHIPEVLAAPVWTEPYFDEGGGGIIMTTYSFPWLEHGGGASGKRLKAIITADVSLEWLTDLVSSLQVGRTGFGFIVSETGTFVTNPHADLIMRQSMFSLADEYRDPKLRQIGRAMTREASGFVEFVWPLTGEDALLAYARIPSPGWSFAAVFPKKELFAELTTLHREVALGAVAGITFLLFVSILVARSLALPLRRIAQATRKVADGDLDLSLADAHRQDEVGQLAQSFGRMAQDLKKYIKDLTETTAARQRIESELSIAAQIQQSMLPSSFPNRDDFDIYAVMRPAKEVGGDFYDFFLIDEDHLCIALGDVSGKGVPAALFMAVTKYLIEAAAGAGNPPDEILRMVNNQLARNNESCMFVTVFLGILDLKTGELSYANGGHNSPLTWDLEREAAFLGPPGGPVLGIMENTAFRMDRLVLGPGALLLAYSDGVTEAFSAFGEAFSERRLREWVTSLRKNPVKEMTEMLLGEIASFCKGAPQADDITILALRFRP
jgi:sigma-B regulation protein RsbU (phosphoserine phosphatase)